MRDVRVDSDHTNGRIVIYEADVDIGIVPLVCWLNSLHGIMTRWSCEGDDGLRPYIVIWVDVPRWSGESSDFDIVEQSLGEYASVRITPECTDGWIHVYRIGFDSKKAMELIQAEITEGAYSRWDAGNRV